MMPINELLSQHYGLENVTIIQDSVGLVDDNYVVRSNSGTYFFKRFRSISTQELSALKNVLITLKAHGIPCPEVVTPISKLSVSTAPVMLTKYEIGQPYSSTIAELKSIATLQQRIIEHGMPAKMPVDVQVLQDLYTKSGSKLQTLGNAYPLTDKHRTIWAYFVEILEGIRPAVDEFPAPIFLMPMHPDFTERNMLFDEAGAVSLICDWQGYGPRILPLELADFLVRFGLKQPFQGVLNQERLQLLGDTLTKGHPFLKEMIGHYRDHFSTLLILKQIASFPFRVDCYYAGNQPRLMTQIIDWSFEFVQWLTRTRDGSSILTFV